MDSPTILRSAGAREPPDNSTVSGTPSACKWYGISLRPMGKPIGYHPARLQRAFRTIRTIRTIRTRAERRTGLIYHFLQKHFRFWQKIGIFLKNCKKIIKKLRFLPFQGLTLQKVSHIIPVEHCAKMLILRTKPDSFTIEL